MSAAELRRAADLAKQRGECSDCGTAGNDLCDTCDGTGRRSGGRCHDCMPIGSGTVECPTCAGTGTNTDEPDALIHLAVADWLELVAAWIDEGVGKRASTNVADAWDDMQVAALAVARAYLGESS